MLGNLMLTLDSENLTESCLPGRKITSFLFAIYSRLTSAATALQLTNMLSALLIKQYKNAVLLFSPVAFC